MAVNGISNEMVAGQPLIEDVLPVLTRFIGTYPVVMTAYNAGWAGCFICLPSATRAGSIKHSGWTGLLRTVRLINLNGREPKYDLRGWDPEYVKMVKGLTLMDEEPTIFSSVKVGVKNVFMY